MKKILIVSILALTFGSLESGQAAYFADSVIDYNPGDFVYSGSGFGPGDDPTVALGQPSGIVGADTDFPGVYSPFDPPFEPSAMVGIGAGGQLTLQLQRYVTVQPGASEIGVWSNVGVRDVSSGFTGTAGNPATTLSAPGNAVVSVSANGTNWVTLNGGAPITFGLPGNFYTNAEGPYDATAPANPQYADFSQPFTGSLSDFNGETYSQMLTTLDGSAGGTWLDLDGTGLSQIGYIRFDVPDDDEETLSISTVSINSALAGDVVPEPCSGGLLVLGTALALGFRRRVQLS